jgi:hypothetical protein
MCFHGSRMATPSVDVVGYSALNFADAACTHSKKIKNRWPGYCAILPNKVAQTTGNSVRSSLAPAVRRA